jgi:hypothetical protein
VASKCVIVLQLLWQSHLAMIVWCLQKNLVINFFWEVLSTMNKVPKWKLHKWKNSHPTHIKNIYKSYKVQCSYPLKTTQDMCFENLCSWKPHYLTTICLMQLMCNYATYVVWKYKVLKNKIPHLKFVELYYNCLYNWNRFHIFFHIRHLTLFAIVQKLLKTTMVQLICN